MGRSATSTPRTVPQDIAARQELWTWTKMDATPASLILSTWQGIPVWLWECAESIPTLPFRCHVIEKCLSNSPIQVGTIDT
jgi:hypothetical protein